MSYILPQPVYYVCQYGPNIVPSGLLPTQNYFVQPTTQQGLVRPFMPIAPSVYVRYPAAHTFQQQVYPGQVEVVQTQQQQQYYAVPLPTAQVQVLSESFVAARNSVLIQPPPVFPSSSPTYANHRQTTTPNYNGSGLLPTPSMQNVPLVGAKTTHRNYHLSNWVKFPHQQQQQVNNQNRPKNNHFGGPRSQSTNNHYGNKHKGWSKPRSRTQQVQQEQEEPVKPKLNANAQEFIPSNKNSCSDDSGVFTIEDTSSTSAGEVEEEEEIEEEEEKSDIKLLIPSDTGSLTQEEKRELLMATWDTLEKMNKVNEKKSKV